MKSETVTRGELTLRKEAIVGIQLLQSTHDFGEAALELYLIGGQTIKLEYDSPAKAESEFKRWKAAAALDKDS